MACVLCDGTAANEQLKYQQKRAEAQHYANEKKVTVILFENPGNGYGYAEQTFYWSEPGGRPIECIPPVSEL